jgi:hypothetical protein
VSILLISPDLADLSQRWWFSASREAEGSFQGSVAPVDICGRNTWLRHRSSAGSASSVWGKMENLEVTLPLKRLTGAGSAKSVCKILSAKDLEVRILITNKLTVHSTIISCTASALTMICFSKVERKASCHTSCHT